ncbi:MAG: energy transducer TonB [Chromatiales bacterium]|nr:energy transducer TonB [Chromatiales bacterium]
MALLGATAPAMAQVSGEVLVGRVDDSLVSASPPADEIPLPGELAEPRTVLLPQPVYPRAARAARQEGRVMVCFTLDERGMVRAPAVRSSTDAVFNQPVLDAISAARFTPAKVGRQPVRSTACRTFLFVLR